MCTERFVRSRWIFFFKLPCNWNDYKTEVKKKKKSASLVFNLRGQNFGAAYLPFCATTNLYGVSATLDMLRCWYLFRQPTSSSYCNSRLIQEKPSTVQSGWSGCVSSSPSKKNKRKQRSTFPVGALCGLKLPRLQGSLEVGTLGSQTCYKYQCSV